MFRFPVWLALVGAILPVVTLVEGIMPLLWLVPGPIRPRDVDQLFVFWQESAKYGVPVGAFIGLVAIPFAFVRHGRANAQCAARFGGNLFWCLVIALLLIAFNDALFVFVVKTTGWVTLRGSSQWALLSPLILAGVFNFVAVLWAIARTIGSDDVLTPRVLMAKLRRSARVGG